MFRELTYAEYATCLEREKKDIPWIMIYFGHYITTPIGYVEKIGKE